MVEKFNKNNKKEYPWLVEFINNNYDMDFYFTSQNARFYITDINTLKLLFKESEIIYTLKENGDYIGVILLWRSFGGEKKRYYIKLVAINEDIAKKLLTVLLWNSKNDLFVKLKKNNKYLPVFRSKGFRFRGGRGVQVLLYRKLIKKETKNVRIK